jgi:hypothetical protein
MAWFNEAYGFSMIVLFGASVDGMGYRDTTNFHQFSEPGEFTLQVNFTTKPWISRPKLRFLSENNGDLVNPNLGISHRIDLTLL